MSLLKRFQNQNFQKAIEKRKNGRTQFILRSAWHQSSETKGGCLRCDARERCDGAFSRPKSSHLVVVVVDVLFIVRHGQIDVSELRDEAFGIIRLQVELNVGMQNLSPSKNVSVHVSNPSLSVLARIGDVDGVLNNVGE